ncbi:MAG: DUF4301 family protein [Bacteroidota bacterium]|nr:DUF4301 family protein [Bacteroidota bacterium]
MLTEKDFEQLKKRGISEAQIEEQLNCFATGFPFLELQAAASLEKGVLGVDIEAATAFAATWEQYLEGDNSILKFVPASGAASRMFKNLFEFIDADYNEPTTAFEKDFFAHIEYFAFYADLNMACQKSLGKDIKALIEAGNYKSIVSLLLNSEGLNYGSLPKGLLKFHNYTDGARTPMEEHLVEGALYAANKSGDVKVHFTVSPEHRALFEALLAKEKGDYEQKFDVKYDVSFSEQKASTDTVAADSENQLFRDKGELLFRPGGHGALIENLNDIDADIIFVKNIDNVVPDNFKEATILYKKVLAGVLVSTQTKIHEYLNLLESGKYSQDELIDIVYFLQNELCTKNPVMKELEDSELALYLKHKLNRPIRVCGMVRNVGEPGGGPFIAKNSDGTWSLQILESSQIDMTDAAKVEMFKNSTHFNPVDLVCAVKDYKGNKFDLTQYVDKQTGFISLKSKSGKELKALELPGLWNGAMSDWNTIFVEVPIETFNPVKTVNDLLRKEHQGTTSNH